MDSQPVQDIEAALREMENLAKGSGNDAAKSRASGKSSRKSSGKQSVKSRADAAPAGPVKRFNPFTWLIKSIVTLIVVVALPFLLLVRVSLYLNVDQQMNVWLAVAAGVGATTLVLLVYSALLRRKFMGTFAITGRMSKMLLMLVLVYSGYSLMYLSGTNVKSEEVKSTYLSLHPALRIATSTLVLADRSLVVTDMGRTPDDYRTMGLPVLENSLHYKQENGYVEAVDIRTQGKPEWVNQMVRFYFWAMGFNTLRHTGTADHLHVSVPQV
ncbi:MAG: hypothetical protein AAF564_14085 [Bacteroidota bacterium]